MSLKDRLGNQTKAIAVEKQEMEPIYYSTNEVSQNIDSLGEIETLFADEDINTIYVLGAKNVYIERKGKKSKISLSYRDNIRLENVIRKNAQLHGIQIDEAHPYIEFSHKSGINVISTLPPLSNVPNMFIKCYQDKFATIKALAENQALSKEIAFLIEALASLKLNIVIAGEKNTLKTTLLSAIAKKVPQNNNAVLIDYSNEIEIENNNVAVYNFKNYQNESLIQNILCVNPDKIFLNDCEDFSCFEKYMNSGYRGICATFCAKNPIDVLNMVSPKNIDVVIFVEKRETKRLISSISVVKNNELETIIYLDKNLEHKSSGIVPDFYEQIEQNGMPVSNTMFDSGYKHTYYKTIQNEVLASALKKNLNINVLKKFRKEYELKQKSEQITENSNQEEPIEQEENVQNI